MEERLQGIEAGIATNSLLDLLLKKTSGGVVDPIGDDGRIIYEYIASEEVGNQILEDFMQHYDEVDKTVPLDNSGTRKVGLINDIMALSTLLEIMAFNVDISRYESIYFLLIERIFDQVYAHGHPEFNATPYWTAHDQYQITSYVESASKLISTFVDLRDEIISRLSSGKVRLSKGIKLTIGGQRIDTYKVLLMCVEKIIADAMNTIVDAALPLKEEIEFRIDGKKVNRAGISSKLRIRGWAFQKPETGKEDDYESSLFYTYYGTNAFISLYNSMEDFYEYIDLGGTIQPSFMSLSDKESREKREKFLHDKEFYEKNAALFTRMREYTASAGRYIDMRMRENGVNIAFDYLNKDLLPVSLETIASGKNNHIMNSLFVFAILINSGLDDDYSSVGKTSMYQSLQFALNNIKKIYTEFKDDHREDLIDSYSLGEDKCPGKAADVMQYWRKSRNIQTYNLIPLFCNTYNLMFNFIIKYPHKEMRENIVLVLENKSETGWTWTKEGFDINNNLYYIYALDSFYQYYDHYEAGFVAADSLRAEAERYKLDAQNIQQSSELRIQTIQEEYERRIEEARKEGSPLEQAVSDAIKTALHEQFGEILIAYLKELADRSVDFLLECANGGGDKRDAMEALLEEKEDVATIMLLSGLNDIARDIKSTSFSSGSLNNVLNLIRAEQKDALRGKMKSILLDNLCK